MRSATFGLAVLLIVVSGACGADGGSTPSGDGATPTTSSISPTASVSAAAPTCTEANAADLTGDDPYTITVRNFRFRPDCFIAEFDSSTIAIVNKDNVDHTFTIDDTFVDAPLPPHGTYERAGATGILSFATYAFHCSIHPEMTGTIIVV